MRLSAFVLGVCLLASAAAQAGTWLPGFLLEYDGAGALDGTVGAMTVFEGRLIVGGTFRKAGDQACRYVAAWDGTNWQPLGQGPPAAVWALAVYDGQLWAGGYRWNGVTWEDVLQADAFVFSLAVHAGRLYAGGSFTHARGTEVNRLACWDGSVVTACGGGLDGTVRALTSDGASLFAGGQFGLAGAVEARNLARWDGSAWHALGAGITGGQTSYDTYGFPHPEPPAVWALAVQDGQLVAGGCFVMAGTDTVWNIASWDGAGWRGLGRGILGGTEVCDMGMSCESYPPYVFALLVEGTDLYAAGRFTRAGGADAHFVARWDGVDWRPLGDSLELNDAYYYIPDIHALHPWDGGILAGGEFWSEDGGLQHLAMWREEQWQGLIGGVGLGVNLGMSVQLVLGDSLIAGGIFTRAGAAAASRIASFDGTGWRALGAGIAATGGGPAGVDALIEFGGDIVAGGFFDLAGGQPALNVARWSGGAWHAMGAGIAERVASFAVYGGQLYAGTQGALPAHLFRWDGETWQTVLEVAGGGVATLLSLGDELLIGGSFLAAGGVPASYLALLGDGGVRAFSPHVFERGSIEEAVLYRGELVVAGSFWYVDGNDLRYLARWDGAGWAALGTPFTSFESLGIEDVLVRGDQLLVGGIFTGPGDSPNRSVAMYRDGTWHTFSGGCDWFVDCLGVLRGDLYVGGSFDLAGGVPVRNFACWRDAATPVRLLALTVDREGRGARVSWELGGAAGASGSTVQVWREVPAGEAGRVGEVPAGVTLSPVGAPVAAEPGYHSVVDAEAPGGGAAYWLQERSEPGDSFWLGSTQLAALPPFGRVAILEASPNPFNPSVRVRLTVPEAGHATVTVHDLRGRLVATLHEGILAAGEHTVRWDGREARGRSAPAGRYFVRVLLPGGRDAKGITLVR